MNTFTWLLLGHLVGDWMLQNDWMARNKQKRLFTLAGMTHFVIYTICIVGFVMLFIDGPHTFPSIIYITLIVFISHWIIDATSLAQIWAKLIQQSDLLMVRVVVDQCFHLLILAFLSIYFF